MSALNHERLTALLALAVFLLLCCYIAQVSIRRTNAARRRARMLVAYLTRRRFGAPFDWEHEEDWR